MELLSASGSTATVSSEKCCWSESKRCPENALQTLGAMLVRFKRFSSRQPSHPSYRRCRIADISTARTRRLFPANPASCGTPHCIFALRLLQQYRPPVCPGDFASVHLEARARKSQDPQPDTLTPAGPDPPLPQGETLSLTYHPVPAHLKSTPGRPCGPVMVGAPRSD